MEKRITVSGAFSVVNAISIGLALALTTFTTFTGCETPSNVTSTPSPSILPLATADDPCTEAFTKTISPLRIQGGHHIYFDSSVFDFLADPQIRYDRIALKTNLKGKYNGSDYEVPLGINGLQAVPGMNSREYELENYDSSKDSSRVLHRLDKMILNGSYPIQFFMMQIKTQKGEIKLSPMGANIHVLDAWIEISGTQPKVCSKPSADPQPTPTATDPAPEPTSTITPNPTPTITQPPVAPRTTIDQVVPAELLTNSTTIAIHFSSDQMGVQFSCSVNDGSQNECSSPFILSNLESGSYSFKVVARNAAGLLDPLGATHSWSVDTIAPSVTITNADSLKTRTNSGSIEFSMQANDPLASLLCSIDGESFAECLTPVSFAGLSDGTHLFSVKAKDPLGNTGVAADFQWVVDQTPPVVQIVQANPSAPIARATTMDLSFTISEASSSLSCFIDANLITGCASPVSLDALAEGPHRFQVMATDLAGNLSNEASYSWSIDLTPPVLSIGNVLPASGSTSNAPTLSAEFSASEASSISCVFDGILISPCVSPYVAPVLSEGNHELTIRATDTAGNQAEPVVLSWIIDYQAPVLSFGTILPSAASHLASSWLSAQIFASEESQLFYNIDGGFVSGFQSPLQLSALADGHYSLAVNGIDLAGNQAVPITHSFTIDTQAPRVSASSRYSGKTNQIFNEFTFAADENANFECNLNGAGFVACSSPWTISGFISGSHTLSIRATDLAGNTSSPVVLGWEVDTTPPITQLAGEQTSNTNVNLNFSSSEPGTFTCSIDGAAYFSCSSPMSIDDLGIGNHVFTVYATDVVGNTDPAGASFTWTVDPAATTTLTAASPASLTNQTSASFGFKSNVTAARFLCSLDSAAASLCSSPVNYANLNDGAHSFRVFAMDRFGATDPVGASYSWTVDTIAPTVLSISHSIGRTSVTITWTTNEASTSRASWGAGTDTSKSIADNGQYTTSHTITISGLYPNTTYSYIIGGIDRATNLYQYTKRSFRTTY